MTFVSVIIPCRNEEKFIGKCLNSIILQDYPKDKLEVLVIDGMSEDGTREIINKFKIQKQPFGESDSRPAKFKIQLIDNPQKFTPFALNIGVKKAKGGVVIRMDAHAVYEKDYISKCLKYLKEYKVDNVGGIIKTVPVKNNLIAKSIVLPLSHPFGQVGSYFRIGVREPKLVDTVFGGCYKREVFEKIGFFNENLIRTQDMEFNLRLKRAGGKILLVPDIVSYYYYPRSNFKDFFLHKFKDGFWQTYEFRFTKKPYCLRHYLPLLLVLILIGSGILAIFSVFFTLFLFLVIGLYLFFAFNFSLKIAIQKKEWKYLFLAPFAFICRHFGHGLGSLAGVLKIFLP